MEQIRLAGTSLHSSRAVLGTMAFGAQLDEGGARRVVDLALDAGVNHVDTANAYNAGLAESVLGKVLAGRRHEVIVATKAFNPVEGVQGLDRRSITRALEGSLRRLGTDYVDLFYLHQPDWDTPLDETAAALDDLVRRGLVRYPAVSNYASWQIAQLRAIADRRGHAPIHVAQMMYNLITRDLDQEYAAFAAEYGMATLVYNPLAAGLLTGKYASTSDTIAEGSRFSMSMYRDRYWSERQLHAAGQVVELAAGAGLTPVQLSLGWLFAQPLVSGVILGGSSVEQFEANLAAADTRLDPGLLPACDAIWRDLRGPLPQYNR